MLTSASFRWTDEADGCSSLRRPAVCVPGRRTAFLLIERPRGRDGLARSYRGIRRERPVAHLALQTSATSHTPVHLRIRAFEGCFWTTRDSYHRRKKSGKGSRPRIPDRGVRCYDRMASSTAAGPRRPGGTCSTPTIHARRAGSSSLGPGEQVANLVFYGLYALQHRGQESADAAVADGRGVLVYKEMGLVSQVFDEPTLATLQGHLAIGHTRYSTTGGSRWENAHVAFKTNAAGGGIALAHNGNLTNTASLAESLGPGGPDGERGGGERRPSSDTDVMAECAAGPRGRPVAGGGDRLHHAPPRGGVLARDHGRADPVRGPGPNGVRPLCIGKLPGGWVIASETAALDIVGATLVREVEPGEVVAIDSHGLRARRFAPAEPRLCVFEHVYLARADSNLGGQSVHQVRCPRRRPGGGAGRGRPGHPGAGHGLERGRRLRRGQRHPLRRGPDEEPLRRPHLHPAEPDHAPARHPHQAQPAQGGDPGLRLVVLDDSIVRGNTTKAIVTMLREAGAREIHVRITSPPVRWPCFYGIDMPTWPSWSLGRPAHRRGGQLRRRRLARLPVAGGSGLETAASPVDGPGGLCTACFTGNYPIPVEAQFQGKELLEGLAPQRQDDGPASAVCRRTDAGRPEAVTTQVPRELLTHAQAGVDVEAGRPRRLADAGRGRGHPRAPGAGRHRRVRRAVAVASDRCCGGALPTRCWPRPATGSAPSCWSPRPSTATTPSASTWSPWWSTTWSFPGPSRCSSSTTWPWGGSTQSGSRLSPPGWPRAAGWPAAPCSAARTAEHPDAMDPDAYDLAGFALGVVDRDRLLGLDRVAGGDVLLGLAASGLHANGFSLACRPRPGRDRLRARPPRARRPVGEALLTPTRSTPPPWSTCSPPASRSTPSATSPAAASPATSLLPPSGLDGPGRPRLVGAAAHLPGPRRPGPGHR